MNEILCVGGPRSGERYRNNGSGVLRTIDDPFDRYSIADLVAGRLKEPEHATVFSYRIHTVRVAGIDRHYWIPGSVPENANALLWMFDQFEASLEQQAQERRR